jgi:hypothetical protein
MVRKGILLAKALKSGHLHCFVHWLSSPEEVQERQAVAPENEWIFDGDS